MIMYLIALISALIGVAALVGLGIALWLLKE